MKAERAILVYGMGITQHQRGANNVQQIANLALLRGNVGREGAGVCPVRGHSNVQGDRTVGITEIPNFGAGVTANGANTARSINGRTFILSLVYSL